MIKDPRFLRFYEQELLSVRKFAGEFASEHARVASRIGLDGNSCADPHVEWLMDGFAFLAARIQEKLDGDYALFTQHLLEMIYPDYLAPTPAMGIVLLDLLPDAPHLENGFTVPRGTKLRSRPLPGEDSGCMFTTAQAVTLWPIELIKASYLDAAALADYGAAVGKACAGLLLRLRTRNGASVASLNLDRLVLHLASRDRAAHRLHEELIGHAVGLVGRSTTGEPETETVPLRGRVSRVGFGEDEALFPPSPRGFSGFRLLREYFALPARFLFVALDGLRPLMRRTAGTEAEVVVLFDRFESTLKDLVVRDQFELSATPAINLFPGRAKSILITPHEGQHQIVVERPRTFNHEVFAVTDVRAIRADGKDLEPFTPFYAVTARDSERAGGYYSVERRPRLVDGNETRTRTPRSAYLGSEVWLELCNAAGGPLDRDLKRLDIDVLVSNRDAPLHLPLPLGETHFSVEIGGPVSGARVAGALSSPKPSPAAIQPREGGPWGDVAWRLVGHLALNYHSLVDGPGESRADALRGLLELHAAGAEPQVARQVDAVRGVRTRTVTGRLPGGGPITFGRGLEVTLEMSEASFQDGSAFLLGGVLEVFFRRYVTLNSFVETVVRTTESGEIMRWPSQAGSRQLA